MSKKTLDVDVFANGQDEQDIFANAKVEIVPEGKTTVSKAYPVKIVKHNNAPVIAFEGNVYRGGFKIGFSKLKHILAAADFLNAMLNSKAIQEQVETLKTDDNDSMIDLRPVLEKFNQQ